MAKFEKPTSSIDLVFPLLDDNGLMASSLALRVYEDYKNSIITINYIPRDFSANRDSIIAFGDQILATLAPDNPIRKKDLFFKSLPDPVTQAVAILKHPRAGIK